MNEKAQFMKRVANAQARADGKREPFRSADVCPNCKADVPNRKSHFVPGNWVTPAGWACPEMEPQS
jgi:hypothetical protein